MTYGSPIDCESQMIKKFVLSTTVAELYSFIKWFSSCQFLRGLWLYFSSEVANFHMRTDAKNLVTTARTIHLPEQRETIHIFSMLRKEACSGSIHDLAPIPSQNRLADCLTKASAKANNLITAVKTGRLLDVDTHPGFRTLVQGFLTYLIHNIDAHKGQGCFLPDCQKFLSHQLHKKDHIRRSLRELSIPRTKRN